MGDLVGGSVFLSHASDDKQRIVALGLIQALQDRGLTVIVDRPESFEGLPLENMRRLGAIKLGAMWHRDLSRLLEKAGAVLACWSNSYAKRFIPDSTDSSMGQYVREETEEAYEGGYLAHVVLDEVNLFPVQYATLKVDRQLLELYKLGNNKDALENGYGRLVELILGKIKFRQAKALGDFERRAWSAIRFLNRAEQEKPLRAHFSPEPPSGLYIMFGPKLEDPDQFYQRLCQFTMPAQEEQRKNRRPWAEISKDYMRGSFAPERWHNAVIPWPRAARGAGTHGDAALAEIAYELEKLVPPIADTSAEPSLEGVLQAIREAGVRAGTSYFAYSFIPAERWAKERTSIGTCIQALGRSLVGASVANFRFLVVIETAGSKLTWWWLLAEWCGLVPSLGKTEGGKSSAVLEGRPLWFRLPDLPPLKDADFSAWAILLAEAWGLEAEAARLTLLEKFASDATSFAPASKVLLENVLPALWLRSQAKSQ
jgi:hypothetical protein